MLYGTRLINASKMETPNVPKDSVSAYVAGNYWDVHPDTVKKWIYNGKVKGYIKRYDDGLVRYWVKKTELDRIRRIIKDENDRKRGQSLFKEK